MQRELDFYRLHIADISPLLFINLIPFRDLLDFSHSSKHVWHFPEWKNQGFCPW